jgi:hypothetical protein
MPDQPQSEPHWRRQAFLLCLSHIGNVTVSAEWAGCRRSQVYHWRGQDAEFAAAWDDALQAALDLLEHLAWQQATRGVEIPYFYKGEQVAVIRRFSERLMIQLLKARPPAVADKAAATAGGDSLHGQHIEAELERKLAELFGEDEPADAPAIPRPPDPG